jgi:hypothetical protein
MFATSNDLAQEKIDARVPHLPAVPSTEPEEAMAVLTGNGGSAYVYYSTSPVERLPVAA